MEQTADLLFQNCQQELSKHFSPEEARAITIALLDDGHGISRTDVVMRRPVQVDQALLTQQLQRLLTDEPVQYVTGKAHFMHRVFQVSPATLIPRPETEELVQWIVEAHDRLPLTVWDIGTGSGCIAISLASLLPQAQVFATDISSEALKVAQSNNVSIGTGVSFVQSNILDTTPILPAPDLIVSNPPYIPLKDREEMKPNVLRYEPGTALFVDDDDPLIFYRRIAQVAMEVLPTGGKLYFEMHERLGQEVLQLFSEMGFRNGIIRQDMQGKDRMVRTEKP